MAEQVIGAEMLDSIKDDLERFGLDEELLDLK